MMKKKIGSIRHFWSVFVVLALLASMIPVFMLHSPSVVQAATTNTQMLVAGGTEPSTSALRYSSLNAAGEGGWYPGWSATQYKYVVTTAGYFASLKAETSGAPGGGKEYAFMLRKNGGTTDLTCTISGSSTQAADITHQVDVLAGDYVDIRCRPDNTPASVKARCSIEFVASTSKYSLISANATSWATSTAYNSIGTYVNAHTSAAVRSQSVFPLSGTLRNLYVILGVAPGGAASRTVTVNVNGVNAALTCTISASGTTGNDTSHTVAINAGDLVSIECAVSGSPSSADAAWGVTFEAATDNTSLVFGSSYGARQVWEPPSGYMPNASTSYNAAAASGGSTWEATESNYLQGTQTGWTVQNFYIKLNDAPGTARSWTFTNRINSANGNITATISASATSANDTTHTDTFTDYGEWDLKCVPASSPSDAYALWGMALYGPTILEKPIVTVQTASSVEETTATLNGNITSTGGENCDYRGFVYDTSTHADPGNVAPASSGHASNWTENGTYGTGAFNHGITSLTQGYTYYYRACAHNSKGWDYSGSEETFVTKPEAPTSFNASNPGLTTIDLSWSKGTGAVNTYIRGKDGSYPTDRADGYSVYNSTGTSTQDTGLTDGHTYYYRAWSWVSGTVYSDSYGQDYDTTLVLSISLSPGSYGWGIVGASETPVTGLDYFTITNTGGVAVDITIHGHDMTGSGTTWTLSDTATPGDGICGYLAGLEGGSYNIIVKKNTTYNTLKSNLAASGTQKFGLELLSPTANLGSVQVTGTITLTVTEH